MISRMSMKEIGAQFESFVHHLQCVRCGGRFGPHKVAYTCPDCGPAEGMLDVVYDMDRVAGVLTHSDLLDAPQNHWRYGPLLPVTAHHLAASWPIGWTPIIEAPQLAATVGVKRLRLKDDGRNASGSFKDRASSVGVVRAAEAGAKAIACASTGNAAVSLAACAAMAGMPAYIFVSTRIPEGKLAQLLIYGATVFRVNGSYDDAYQLCSAACQEFNWYNRNCAYNPYLVEGKKTGGLEIAEQCAGDPPDWVAMSVGDGCSIAGVGKGLRQMVELGLGDCHETKLLGVQAAGVAPITAGFDAGTLGAGALDAGTLGAGAFDGGGLDAGGLDAGALGQSAGDTFADSINCPVPRNWRKAMNEVRQSGGRFVNVTDDEIRQAMRDTGRLAGVFAEPAAAAAVAGVARAVRDGVIDATSSVLAYITGNGLKDVKAAIESVASPVDVEPNLSAVATALNAQ